jgi:hypothetical protein
MNFIEMTSARTIFRLFSYFIVVIVLAISGCGECPEVTTEKLEMELSLKTSEIQPLLPELDGYVMSPFRHRSRYGTFDNLRDSVDGWLFSSFSERDINSLWLSREVSRSVRRNIQEKLTTIKRLKLLAVDCDEQEKYFFPVPQRGCTSFVLAYSPVFNESNLLSYNGNSFKELHDLGDGWYYFPTNLLVGINNFL